MRPISASWIPIPLSSTRQVSQPSCQSTASLTNPSWVNFTALLSRLCSTWESLRRSPIAISGTWGDITVNQRSPFWAARGRCVSSRSLISGPRAKGAGSQTSRPALIFDQSRASFSRLVSWPAAACRLRKIGSWCGAGRLRSSTCSMPVTALSGVRISWLITARKSSLAREASSARPRASSRVRTCSAILPDIRLKAAASCPISSAGCSLSTGAGPPVANSPSAWTTARSRRVTRRASSISSSRPPKAVNAEASRA